MKTQEEIIRGAIALVKEKTGIDYPYEWVIVTDEGFKRNRWAGVYRHGNNIYVRPRLFKPLDEEKLRKRYREDNGCHYTIDENGKWIEITEDEYVDGYDKTRVRDAQHTIIHEIGHWVHTWYFNGRSMYIRGAYGYAHKNRFENFAVGFQQYVQDTLFHQSRRYKRMHTILTEEIKNTYKWKQDHEERKVG